MIPSTVHDAAGSRWHVVRAWPDGDGTVAELIAEQAGGDPAGGDPANGATRPVLRAARWQDDRLQVLPFGSDPKLPALAAALSTASGDDSASADARLVVHRYGKRAVWRESRGYTKILRPGRGSIAADRHDRAARVFSSGIDVPAVVGRTPDTFTLSRIPGRSLGELGRARSGEVAPAWAALGDWLGGMVRRPAEGADLPVHTPGDEAAIVKIWLDRLSATGLLVPKTMDRLRALAGSVAAELMTGDRGARSTVHRDLHDGQLLWDGDRLGLIDLDTAAQAEPAIDPGNLLAHLELRARQWRSARGRPHQPAWHGTDEGLAPDLAVRAGELLLAGTDPAGHLADRIEVYRRAAILRLIGVYVWRPGWRAVAIAWAEDLCASGNSFEKPWQDESSLMMASSPGHQRDGRWTS